MQLRTRLLFWFVLVSIIVLGINSFFQLRLLRSSLIADAGQQLRAVVDLQEERINDAVARYVEWTRLIGSRTQLRASFTEYLETGSESERDRMRAILLDARNSLPAIRSIALFDTNGELIIATDPSRIADAPIGDQIQIQELFKDPDNLLNVAITGPLLEERTVIGGIQVVATADAITSITESYVGLGETGEVMIARQGLNGDGLILTPLRFDTSAALRRGIPAESINSLIINSFDGDSIILEETVTDYRGEEVFAATRRVSSTGWGIVAKVDAEEALTPYRTAVWNLVRDIGVTLLLSLIVGLVVARIVAQPILQMTAAAQKMQSGQYGTRVRIRRNDEIGQLGNAFNDMAHRVQTTHEEMEQQIKSQTEELKQKVAELEEGRMATLNILEDVEEEKQRALAEKEKNEAILQSIGDGVIVVDSENRIVLMNDVAGRIIGVEPHAVVGEYKETLFRVEDEKTGTKSEVVQQILSGHEPIQTSRTMQIRTPDGQIVPIAETVAPLRDGTGALSGAVIVFRDVRHEREVDRAKTEFVSLASHQLRTPLSAINWFAELLLGDDQTLTDEQREYLNEIYDSNNRMIALVDALLNVSRIELGTLAVEPKWTDIGDIINKAQRELQHSIDERQLVFESQVHGDVRHIITDPQLTRMVVQNLISNAIKYTPEGGRVQVDLRNIDKGDVIENRVVEADGIVLTVTDTGFGIPASQQSSIFKKLFRAENVLAKEVQGTGLGLYIVKQIVERNNGMIWFQSVENEGTTFYVVLPVEGLQAVEGTKRLELS